MTRNSSTLSKTARNQLAAAVVASLGDIETLWGKPVAGRKCHDLMCNLNGCVLPNGDTRLADSQHPNRFLSAHERLEVANREKAFSEVLASMGEHLARLFPGQALSWYYHDSRPARHSLFLGCGHDGPITPSNHVIDTVKTRWKAPLLRLSDYLADQDLDPESAFTDWHLLHTINGQGPGVVDSYRGILTRARSLSEMMRLSGFAHNDTSTSPRPSLVDSTLVMALGETWESTHIENAMQAFLESRRADIDTAIRALKQDLDEPLEAANRAFDDLVAEKSMTLTCDLVADSINMDVVDHPMAAAIDIASAHARRAAVRDCLKPIAAHLRRALLSVYPDMRNATLTIRVDASRSPSPARRTWTFDIDGLQRRSFPDGVMANIIQDATLLSHVVKPEPYRHFIVQSRPKDKDMPVNTTAIATLALATGPEHAWLLLFDRDNSKASSSDDPIIQAAYPVPRADWDAAHADLSERIFRIYA